MTGLIQHLLLRGYILCSKIIDSQPVLAHYIIIRQDLSIGQVAAQVTHAAGESSSGNLSRGTIAIVLGVSSEHELLQEEQRLIKLGLEFSAIREPDPPFYGQLMAIGIKPMPKYIIRPCFQHLQLLKEILEPG